MLDDAACHKLARSEFDGFGVVLALQRIRREEGGEEFGVGQGLDDGVWLHGAGDVGGRLDVQFELVGHGLQAVGLLVHVVAEGFAMLGGQFLRLLGEQLLLELVFHLVEGWHVGGFEIGEMNDVVAIVAFHHAADIAFVG